MVLGTLMALSRRLNSHLVPCFLPRTPRFRWFGVNLCPGSVLRFTGRVAGHSGRYFFIYALSVISISDFKFGSKIRTCWCLSKFLLNSWGKQSSFWLRYVLLKFRVIPKTRRHPMLLIYDLRDRTNFIFDSFSVLQAH